MTCNHQWIGDTCVQCGIAWSVWAKERISKLERDVRELEAELREVKRLPTGNQEDSEWSIGF